MEPSILETLEAKKRGEPLSEDHIRSWVQGLVSGEIPAYQSSALLMAIRLNGMSFEETLALTRAMAESGEVLRFPDLPLVCDKHSTGGVGDKVTLILTPLLAACGLPVSMLSGRGLGFTGGTIDKFESLPGASCQQSVEAMGDMLRRFGWANAQASESIDPADRILYALRDVTATVDSVPLITASILSKKMAGGATHLCLDVKCGPSAFMVDREQARILANSLKTIGEMGGLAVFGFLTRMDEPLGHAVGNYLELLESVNYLQTEANTPLMELVYCLGESLLIRGQRAESEVEARAMMRAAIEDGSGLARLLEYLRFIGGEQPAIDRLLDDRFDHYPHRIIKSPKDGWVNQIRGRALGEFLVELGAGRKRTDDPIDPLAGLVLRRHLGDAVKAGEPLAWVFGTKAMAFDQAHLADRISDLFQIDDQARPVPSLILESV